MDAVTEMMERGVKDGVFPGAVLLISFEGEIKYLNAFGVTDCFSKKAMEKDNIFDLASLTKPLATVMAAAKLLEDEKLFLSQTISSVLPGYFSKDKQDITIDHLLHHTSGLPAHREYFRNLDSYDQALKRSKLRQMTADEPLISRPGEEQLYSDLGFIILAWIIEKISGQQMDRFVQGMIYKPLGVKTLFYIDLFNSSYFPDDLYEKIVPTEKCPWRKKLIKAQVHDENTWAVGGIEGHAGLFGDAVSVWKLSMEIMNALAGRRTKALNKNVIQELLKQKKTGGFRAGFDTPSKSNSSSGRYFSPGSIGHLGFTGTSLWMDIDRSVIIVLLTNRVHPHRKNIKIRQFRPLIHDIIMEQILKGCLTHL